MIGDRIVAWGGARVVGALAVGCLVLAALLAVSVIGNVMQFRGSARLAADLGARLAASEARGRAELLTCEQVNHRVNENVRLLGAELHDCQGRHQRVQQQLARALAGRERQRGLALEAERALTDSMRRTYETNPVCRAWGDAPVCRARSDELLGATTHRAPQ